MLYASFLVSVLLALSTSAAAAPSTSTSTEFTFVQWIEDIIADPAGDHLSPEEAVAAKNAAMSNTLQKRVNCDQPWGSANVRLPQHAPASHPRHSPSPQTPTAKANSTRPTTQPPASTISRAKAPRAHSASLDRTSSAFKCAGLETRRSRRARARGARRAPTAMM